MGNRQSNRQPKEDRRSREEKMKDAYQRVSNELEAQYREREAYARAEERLEIALAKDTMLKYALKGIRPDSSLFSYVKVLSSLGKHKLGFELTSDEVDYILRETGSSKSSISITRYEVKAFDVENCVVQKHKIVIELTDSGDFICDWRDRERFQAGQRIMFDVDRKRKVLFFATK